MRDADRGRGLGSTTGRFYMAGILRAMLRPSTACLVLCLAALSAACPRATRTPAPEGSADGQTGTPDEVAEVEPEDRGRSASEVRDRGTGVGFELPEGWTVAGGRGDVVASAYEPGDGAMRLQLRRWDGDPDSLAPLLDRDPWSWSAEGPYAHVPVADGEPLVAAWRVDDPVIGDTVVFAWFFRVASDGLGVLMRVPVTRIEEGWETAEAILATGARRGGA